MEKTVLCGASCYDEKYYFNPLFDKIPQELKDELKIMCVTAAEEAGGIILLVFDEDGSLQFECHWDEGDILYDEIGAGLLVDRYRRNHAETLEMLEKFYLLVVVPQM